MTKVGKLSIDKGEKLGQGRFGTVFEGTYSYSGSIFRTSKITPVAVKRVLRTQLDEDEFFIQREVELMRESGDHPNILRYVCTEMNDDFLYKFYCFVLY